MNTVRVLLPVLAAVAALGSAAAKAAEPETLATAPASASGAPPSVAEQIDTYLKTSPALALPRDGADGVTSGDAPRKIHGTVDVAVGSSGYRSAYVQSDIPVGKTGTVSIAVGESRFKGRAGVYGDGFGYGYGYGGPYSADRRSFALGYASGDAALDPRDPRCRRTGEDGSDLRLDPRFEGGRPRSCPPAAAPTSPPQ
jgi:hypothetical protein